MDALNAWIQRADAFLQRYPDLPAGQDPGDIAAMEREATELIEQWKASPRNAADVPTFDLLLQVGVKVSQVFLRYQTYVQRVLQARPPPGREAPPPLPGAQAPFAMFAPGQPANQGANIFGQAANQVPNIFAQPANEGANIFARAPREKPFIPSGGRKKSRRISHKGRKRTSRR